MPTIAIFDDAIFDDAIFDTRTKNFFTTILDEGGNVSDQISKQSKHFRSFIEGEAAMFDGNIFDPAIFDTEGGSGSITDSLLASKSNPVIINEAAIIISDVLGRILGAKATLVETVTSNDSIARIVKNFRNIVESGGGMFDPTIFDPLIFDVQFGTITISDTIAATRGAVITFNENVSITEDLQRMIKTFRIFAENTIIAELINTKKSAFRLLSDVTTIDETITSKLSAFRAFAESSIIISDMIAVVRGAKVVFIENTVVSELLERLTNQFRSFTETNTISDVLTAFKVVGRRSKQAFAWVNKRTTNAFIFKRKTNAYAKKRKTNARV